VVTVSHYNGVAGRTVRCTAAVHTTWLHTGVYPADSPIGYGRS
jgi:hypothetical protein